MVWWSSTGSIHNVGTKIINASAHWHYPIYCVMGPHQLPMLKWFGQWVCFDGQDTTTKIQGSQHPNFLCAKQNTWQAICWQYNTTFWILCYRPLWWASKQVHICFHHPSRRRCFALRQPACRQRWSTNCSYYSSHLHHHDQCKWTVFALVTTVHECHSMLQTCQKATPSLMKC